VAFSRMIFRKLREKWDVAVALLIAVFAAWYFCFHLIQVGHQYLKHTSYKKMPADDKALETWLKAQPGVLTHTVVIKRMPSDIVVGVMMEQNLAGEPPLPDLSKACEQLGYSPYCEWMDDPRWPSK
jgi:hypothetical protein